MGFSFRLVQSAVVVQKIGIFLKVNGTLDWCRLSPSSSC